ncbi:MAG: cyclase family protein [Spirochaetota bacterium]|nr:MAG: cyclase family protein [Spirochaetota bacterium]
MKVIDISGPIYEGMWNFPDPMGSLLGPFRSSRISFEHSGESYSIDTFDTMKAQTGTYLESPGRYFKNNQYTVNDIPLEKLYMVDTYVYNIPYEDMGIKDGKKFISLEDLEDAESKETPPGSAILVGTGYGKYWDRSDFFERSWFFKKEAMEYLIDKKPLLLGTDSAEWENPRNPEGIFQNFFPANILVLAPCINLEKIRSFRVKLAVLPLKVRGAFICPVRAVVIE